MPTVIQKEKKCMTGQRETVSVSGTGAYKVIVWTVTGTGISFLDKDPK